MNSTKKILAAPYQFLDTVDFRVGSVNKNYGRKYYENILLDAPIISIIPGKPKYMPGQENGDTLSNAIIAANSGDSSAFIQGVSEQIAGGDLYRYYGFERDMTTYMQYVNTLCRTCADFLGVGDIEYRGKPLSTYTWSEYHWSTSSSSYTDSTNNGFAGWAKSVGDEISNALSTALESTYLEFYIDPDCSANESISNTTAESKLKGIFDSGSDMIKELSFIANSGAGDDNVVDQLQDFADKSMQSLADALGSGSGGGLGGGLGSTLQRLLSVGSNVIKGENVIMPDIYQSSSYDKSYTFTVHLKTPYGSALSYYLDIIVPLMHLLALSLPKQTTANTYASPFLVKAYVDGVFNCDLGMVTGISINKNVNDTVINTLGVPTEMDVSITITDLYSDLSMSNADEDPLLFLSNSSLIEYLATTCGLSLLRPNAELKYKNLLHTVQNSFTDIPDNIKENVLEKVSDIYLKFAGL